LALVPPRKRTKRGVKQQYKDVDLSDETVKRQRRVSANRCLAQLKRALQLAREKGKHVNDDWKRAKMFQRVEAPRESFLTVAEAGRLVNACGPDLRELVQAGLVTGCRYGELGRLKVGDFNPDSGTLQIRISKTGKMRHVYLADEGVAFFAGLTAGRQGGDRMFSREWGRSQQNRPMREACLRAKIDPPIGFHQLRHTWASLAVMGGVPLMVVARNLGHVDTQMVEKHYGHLAPSFISDAIKAGAPQFGFAGSNVRAIR
jgi:integrase